MITASLFSALLTFTPLLAPPMQTPLKSTFVAQNAPATSITFITAPPGDLNRLFIVQQNGVIKIVKNGVYNATAFLDITTKVSSSIPPGERGLLGLAFHPNYASNGQFFVYYTSVAAGPIPLGALTIVRYTVSANPDVADGTSGLVFLAISHPASNHNAGMINFGPDGYLYFGTGDGGGANDTSNNAQNINSYLGKMLRLDVDNPGVGTPPGTNYGIPPTNPFAGATAGLDEIWDFGLRNPFRWSFDRITGDKYIGDVGQNFREEVDYERAGSAGGVNYGWRCREGKSCTPSATCVATLCTDPMFTDPIYDYANPGVGHAVIGGYVYRGSAIPDLRGTYFFGDWSPTHIWSFKYSTGAGLTNFTDRTAELSNVNSLTGITTFGQDGNGEIYVGTSTGKLFRIDPASPVPPVGVTSYGTGTPGCNGAHTIGTNSTPTIFNLGFALTCNNAPPTSLGLGIVTNAQDLAGSDPFGLGVLLHVDLFTATLLQGLDFVSDAGGLATAAAPIPKSPAIAGVTLYGQAIFGWTGTCSLPPFDLSSSPGVAFTLQP